MMHLCAFFSAARALKHFNLAFWFGAFGGIKKNDYLLNEMPCKVNFAYRKLRYTSAAFLNFSCCEQTIIKTEFSFCES